MTRIAPALVWAVSSAVLLLGGTLALGLVIGSNLSSAAAGLLYRVIAQQALLPLWLAVLATWLVAARLAPGVERSWSRVSLGLFALAALWFPVVGEYSFLVWQPTSVRDYLATWLLVGGGVAAALLVARRLIPQLRPGAFAP